MKYDEHLGSEFFDTSATSVSKAIEDWGRHNERSYSWNLILPDFE